VGEKRRGGKWERGEVSRWSSRLIFRGGGGGLWWVASDAIGRRGRCLWMALWSECRGIGGVVGGVLVRSVVDRFQRGGGRFGSWRGRHGAPRGWAMRAS
jgi:hypothetical protein